MNDKPEQKLKERPRIAIIDPNTLAILGLKHILQNVLPIMQVDTFNSFAELERANPKCISTISWLQALCLKTDCSS